MKKQESIQRLKQAESAVRAMRAQDKLAEPDFCKSLLQIAHGFLESHDPHMAAKIVESCPNDYLQITLPIQAADDQKFSETVYQLARGFVDLGFVSLEKQYYLGKSPVSA